MVDAPERIWAWPAGNAASTSIFPYDEDTDSSGLVEYVRADVAEALSRTGAVKVKAIAEDAIKMCEEGHPVSAFNLAKMILSALEPAAPEAGALKNEQSAPEGQQEPVAWVRPEVLAKLLDGRAANHADLSKIRGGGFTEPLYTRPAEQAVTEEGVEIAARLITKWLGYSWDGLLEGSVTDKGFRVFTHGQFGWGFQGRKGDMIDLAREILTAALAQKEEGR